MLKQIMNSAEALGHQLAGTKKTTKASAQQTQTASFSQTPKTVPTEQK